MRGADIRLLCKQKGVAPPGHFVGGHWHYAEMARRHGPKPPTTADLVRAGDVKGANASSN
jgi:hypothetical protein